MNNKEKDEIKKQFLKMVNDSTTSFTPSIQDIGDEIAAPSGSPYKNMNYSTSNVLYSRFFDRPKLKWQVIEKCDKKDILDMLSLLTEKDTPENLPDGEDDDFPDDEDTPTDPLSLMMDFLFDLEPDLTEDELEKFTTILDMIISSGEEQDELEEKKLSRGSSPDARRRSRQYYRKHKSRILKRRQELAKRKKATDKIRSEKNKDKKTYRNTSGHATRMRMSDKKNENSFYEYSKPIMDEYTKEVKKLSNDERTRQKIEKYVGEMLK